MAGVDRHPTAAASAAINARLLDAMRRYPGASAAQLASVLGYGTTGMVTGRWHRLGAAGILVRCHDGRWRLPAPRERPIGETDEEDSKFGTAESAPMPHEMGEANQLFRSGLKRACSPAGATASSRSTWAQAPHGGQPPIVSVTSTFEASLRMARPPRVTVGPADSLLTASMTSSSSALIRTCSAAVHLLA